LVVVWFYENCRIPNCVTGGGNASLEKAETCWPCIKECR
jgi:hypothetical protein